MLCEPMRLELVSCYAGFSRVAYDPSSHLEAVDELERVTGLQLAGTHPRIPVEPVVMKKVDAKL